MKELSTHSIDKDHRLYEKWKQFTEKNPHVYPELVRVAREAKSSGVKRWGIQAIFNILRWENRFKTTGDIYKMNMLHGAFYARLIMENEPDLEGFFNTREMIAHGGY